MIHLMMLTVIGSTQPGLWQGAVTNTKAHHIIHCMQVQPIHSVTAPAWLQSQQSPDHSNQEMCVVQVQLVYLARHCRLTEFASMQIYGKARPLWSLILSAAFHSAAMKETLQLDQFNTKSGGRRANKKPDLFMASTHDDNAYMSFLLISWNVSTLCTIWQFPAVITTAY